MQTRASEEKVAAIEAELDAAKRELAEAVAGRGAAETARAEARRAAEEGMAALKAEARKEAATLSASAAAELRCLSG